MSINQSVRLETIITPDNASDKKVKYYSDNVLVAKISEKGILTTYKEGVANITATTEDGNHTDSCTIYVSSNEEIVWVDTEADAIKHQKAKKGKLKAKGKDDESILVTWKGY